MTTRLLLRPGVEFVQTRSVPPEPALLVNVLRIDPRAPGVHIAETLGRDAMVTDDSAHGKMTVGAASVRHGALAAVNAGYFGGSAVPLGLSIHGGELWSDGLSYRVAFGITREGKAVVDTLLMVATLTSPDGSRRALDGLNRAPGANEMVALTPIYGAYARVKETAVVATLPHVSGTPRAGGEVSGAVDVVAPGDARAAIPRDGMVIAANGPAADWLRTHAKQGDTLRCRFDLTPFPLEPGKPDAARRSERIVSLRASQPPSVWQDVVEAVSAGPWLVRDGSVYVDAAEEGFDKSHDTTRHPRTAIGVADDGTILLVTVDGRHAISRGASLRELAGIMRGLGAVQAINLDGGGSTAMVVRGLYVNRPSEGSPRAVADTLQVLVDDTPGAAPPDVPLPAVAMGLAGVLRLTPPAELGAQGVWGTLDGVGFVDQRGMVEAIVKGTRAAGVANAASRWVIPITWPAPPTAQMKPATPTVADPQLATSPR